MMVKSEQLESQSTTTSTQKHSSKPKKFCRFLKYSSMKFDLFFIKFWKSLWTLSVLLDNHNNNNEDNNNKDDNIHGNEGNHDKQTSDINTDTNDSMDNIDSNSVMNNNGSNFNAINDCEGDFDPDLTLTQSYNSTLISPKLESNSKSHNTLSVLSDLDSDIGNNSNGSDGYNGNRLVLTRTPAIPVTPLAPGVGVGSGSGLGLGLIPMDDDMDMDMCGLVPPMIGVNLQVYDSHADDNDDDFDNNNNNEYEYDYDSDYYYNLQMCNDNDVIHNSDSDMGIHYLSDYTSSDDSSDDDDSDLYGLQIGFPETPKYFDYCNETSNWKPKWLRNRDDSDEYFSGSDSITLTVSVTMSTNDDKLNVKDRTSDSSSQSNIIFNHSDVMITENNDSGDYDNNDNDNGNDDDDDDDNVSESSTPTYNRSYV